MNEQTKIELLKIATDLAVSAIAKYPSVAAPNPIAGKAKTYIDIFNDCMTAVNDQYQALNKGSSE